MTDIGNETLSARQEKAIAALIACKTVEEAAVKAKISPRSLHRWIHEDPTFQMAYRQARREALDNAIASLQTGAVEAVQALRDAPTHGSVNVRVRAAAIFLEHALAANAQFNLQERLEALEGDRGEEYSTSW